MSQLDIFAAQSIANERERSARGGAHHRHLARRPDSVTTQPTMSVWERLMAALDPSHVVPDVRAR